MNVSSIQSLPGESARAFAAFRSYVLMQPEARSIDGAYRLHKGPKGGKRAPGCWSVWSTRFHWRERAAAHDRGIAAAVQRGIERAAEDDAKARHERRQQFVDLEYDVGIEILTAAKGAAERGVIPGVGAMATAGSILCRRALRLPVTIEVGDPSSMADLFFETDGQLEAAMPEGAVPPMPANVLEKPQINAATRGEDNNDLRQPNLKAIRPG